MGKTIAAVDHGPAALINAMNIKLGSPLERFPILFRKQACNAATAECWSMQLYQSCLFCAC
jgi:hypothetical protein